MRPAGTIRVVSWNIHGSVGSRWRCDPGATLGAIRRLQPDILALQEVDGRVRLGRKAGAFETLRDGLGGHVVEARMVRKADSAHDYGHLLWSRWPLMDYAVHPLPGGRIEPRGVISATCDSPGVPLHVLSTHFGLAPQDRRRQAVAMAAMAAMAGEGAMVALGDFNEWAPNGPVHLALSAVLPVFAMPRTWPARAPFVRMDRLYASEGTEIVSSTADRDARRVSDHLPLVADIRLRART